MADGNSGHFIFLFVISSLLWYSCSKEITCPQANYPCRLDKLCCSNCTFSEDCVTPTHCSEFYLYLGLCLGSISAVLGLGCGWSIYANRPRQPGTSNYALV